MGVTNFDTIQAGAGLVGNLQTPVQVISGDGAIAIPSGSGAVFLTKGSAAAITIPAPVAGAYGTGDDGKEITIISETAFAHVVTCVADGFNAKGSSGTATASAAANNWFKIIARNGHWRVIGNLNFTIA